MLKKFILNIPKRYVIVLMVFFGYLNVNYLHANLSMVVVTITSNRQLTSENGTTFYMSPEFDWDSKQRAVILGSFNYGYFLGPIGGVLTGKFGGSTIYGISIAIMAVVTFITPFLLRINYILYFLANFLIGSFEAFIYASTSQIWSRWAPLNERSKFISFSIIGGYVGPVISFVFSGFILKRWNWSVLYYVSGIFTLIWYWVWFFVVYNDPDEDKHISQAERSYIKERIQHVSTHKLNYPWRKIFTSIPLLAGCISKFTIGCGGAFAIAYLPQFVKDLSNLDIDKIGYVSAIPMISTVISIPICGCLADYMRKNKLMSLTNIHKLYISISLFTGMAIFVVIGFWPSITASMVCLSVLYFFSSFATIDIQILILDLAPKFAGLLNSFFNIFYTSSKVLTPTIVGFVVTNHSRSQWDNCFLIFGLIYLFGACFFLKFGSGDL